MANYETHYDYDRQAWVVNGNYSRCGHDYECFCYGRIHEGESCICEGCDTEPTTTEASYVEQGYALTEGSEQIEAYARERVALRTTFELVAAFDASSKEAPLSWDTATVRGWIMDELERRSPEAYAYWMNSADESPRRFFAYCEAAS